MLKFLYIGCQWKELPIEKDESGRPEIHYTRIYSVFRRWESDGCMNAIFVGSVLKLHQNDLLNTSVIHSDGDRLRYSDESLRYRGALRAEHLQRRMTSTGYDPITGAPIERVHVPEAPKRPGQ